MRSRCPGFGSCGTWALELRLSSFVAHGLSCSVACRISWTRDQVRVPCIDRQILIYCITREVPDSFLLLHCVWPWPSWQPSKPRPWGRGRFWTLSLSTDMDLVTWLLLSAWEPGERGPPSRLLLAAKIWGLGRMRADFEDSQQSLPHFHGSWKRRWHWGCLSCLLNFSAIVAFLVGLCLAFAGQEGVFLHKMMLAL